MAGVDFGQLRTQIAEAARCAFASVQKAHEDETFYTFALYSTDDAVGITPAANSNEAFTAQRAELAGDDSLTEADLLGNFRWSPFDWEYDCEEGDAFRSIDRLISVRGRGRYDRGVPDGFVQFKAGVFASMVLALSDLVAAGTFGTTNARRSVTVFCTVADSECAPWLEADSAKRLNPPAAYKRFATERLAYIAETPDELTPAGDPIYAAYLKHM